MPPRAVLFEFDGVLADTENVHIAAWQRTFRALGWVESDETCAGAAAVDDRVFVSEVFARRKVEGGDIKGWSLRKQTLTIQLLRDRPHLQPDIPALIQALKDAGALLGVVTSTRRANVDAVLAATGLLDAFDVIVAGDDVAKTKPDPAGYRLAIKRLGVRKGEAVAVEGSTLGSTAAALAGIRVVVVRHAPAEAEVPGSRLPRMDDLVGVLAALGF